MGVNLYWVVHQIFEGVYNVLKQVLSHPHLMATFPFFIWGRSIEMPPSLEHPSLSYSHAKQKKNPFLRNLITNTILTVEQQAPSISLQQQNDNQPNIKQIDTKQHHKRYGITRIGRQL